MKLHSNHITRDQIMAALRAAQVKGRVTGDIEFITMDNAGSRSCRAAYEIQLGTYDKTSGPTKSRHYKNSGHSGADSVWAATYDEWGWFIAELFAIDPDATFGPYKGVDGFHEMTEWKYAD